MAADNRHLVTVDESPASLAVTEPHDPRGIPSARPLRPRLSDPPPDISDAAAQRLAVAKRQAENLEELTAAVYLKGLATKSFGDAFDPAAYQAFRDKFLRDAGDSADPLEQMLLEQAMLCHHHIGHLHQRALDATSPEAAKVFYSALARLQGESRRLALALRIYRSPLKSKHFTVVRQQNIAAGDQQVALVEGAAMTSNKVPNSCDDTQVVSTAHLVKATQDDTTFSRNSEPQARSRRKNQSCKARGTNSGGA